MIILFVCVCVWTQTSVRRAAGHTWRGKSRGHAGRREILFRRTIGRKTVNRGEENHPHQYTHTDSLCSAQLHLHFSFFLRWCATDRTASPNHTDNLLNFTRLFSARLVCTFSLFFLRRCSLFLSSLLIFFLAFLFATHFFLLCFSSFYRARVVFRLIPLFFFLLLVLHSVPFSHAPPRLLIARNRCDFAPLYVLLFCCCFIFRSCVYSFCFFSSFQREQLD